MKYLISTFEKSWFFLNYDFKAHFYFLGEDGRV